MSIIYAGQNRKNIVINGNFDIWQRGTSETTDNTDNYRSVDRFINSSYGSSSSVSRQTFTVGQTDVPGNPKYYSRTVASSSAGINNFVIKKCRIEDVALHSNKYLTLSFWAKADSTKNIATSFKQFFGSGPSSSPHIDNISPATHNLTSSWQKFSTTVFIPSVSGKVLDGGDDSLRFFFWFDAGSSFNTATNSLGQQSGTFDIARVQLEEGTTATDLEYRPLAEELNLCYRYFYRLSQDSGVSVGVGLARTTSSLLYHVPFPVEMRAVPSINFSSSTCLSIGRRASFIDCSDVSTTLTRNISTNILATDSTASFNAGEATIVRVKDGDYVDISAEM